MESRSPSATAHDPLNRVQKVARPAPCLSVRSDVIPASVAAITTTRAQRAANSRSGSERGLTPRTASSNPFYRVVTNSEASHCAPRTQAATSTPRRPPKPWLVAECRHEAGTAARTMEDRSDRTRWFSRRSHVAVAKKVAAVLLRAGRRCPATERPYLIAFPTAVAREQHHGDVFISIHVNATAHSRRRCAGARFETIFWPSETEDERRVQDRKTIGQGVK